jgi:shikimate dehydrogenase
VTSDIPYAEVIGDPIAHSKSPLIHNFWLNKLGIEGEYHATLVPSGGLGSYLAQRKSDPDWRGCSITMPHKREAMKFAPPLNLGEHLMPSNLLTPRNGELKGHNTDLLGILEAIGGKARTEDGIIIVGNGAAAETALMAVSQWTHPITIVARDPAKARGDLGKLALLANIIGWGEAWPQASLLVNASPLGMNGYPPFPFALDSLREGSMVFDMVYAPLATDLLRRADTRGLTPVDGLRMLVGQARHQFLAFFGALPPPDHDSELRELLTA